MLDLMNAVQSKVSSIRLKLICLLAINLNGTLLVSTLIIIKHTNQDRVWSVRFSIKKIVSTKFRATLILQSPYDQMFTYEIYDLYYNWLIQKHNLRCAICNTRQRPSILVRHMSNILFEVPRFSLRFSTTLGWKY